MCFSVGNKFVHTCFQSNKRHFVLFFLVFFVWRPRLFGIHVDSKLKSSVILCASFQQIGNTMLKITPLFLFLGLDSSLHPLSLSVHVIG
jgi:hypothetical protein